MKEMVLVKADGTYEEMEMTTDKIIYFQSRGYIVSIWKEMFEGAIKSTTERIKELIEHGNLLAMRKRIYE